MKRKSCFLNERVDMNEMITVAVGVVGVVAILAFMLYQSVRGVHGSLTTAQVGDIYNFEYEQPHRGDPERVLAKVIRPVAILDEAAIRRLNARSAYRRNDPAFQRTKHLVTCEMPTGEIRNFYAERTRNVRRSVFGGRMFRTAVAAML
jgi:hypothetical protein